MVGLVRGLGQSVAVLNLAVAGAVVAAAATHTGDSVPLAFAVAGLGCMCLASVVVRFSARMASAGGIYTYIARGLGPSPGFLGGWLYGGAFAIAVPVVLAIGASSLAALLANHVGWELGWFACFVILLGAVSVLASLDVRLSTATQVVLGAGCMLAILLLAVIVLGKGASSGLTAEPFDPSHLPSSNGFFLGVAFAFSAFIGFEAAAAFGEEATTPRITIPRAVMTAAVLVVAWYVFIAWVVVVGFGRGRESEWVDDIAPFDALATRYAGTWLAVLVDLAVGASAFSAALACTNLSARTFFAMGREGGLPRAFAWTHPRFRTPWAGIATTAGVALVLAALLGRRWDTPAPAPFPFVQAFALALTIGVLAAYVLVAVSALASFARTGSDRLRGGLIDAVLPIPAIAICGFTIYESARSPAPAPIRYGPWLAVGWLGVGLAVLAWLTVKKPERVRSFGSILAEGELDPDELRALVHRLDHEDDHADEREERSVSEGARDRLVP